MTLPRGSKRSKPVVEPSSKPRRSPWPTSSPGSPRSPSNDAVTEGYDLDIKRKALVDIGKHLGGFVTRKETGGPGQFNRMSTDELRQRVYERAEAVVAARRATEAAKRGGTPQGKPA